jgi:radical SAM superfamily enzyme with C-terminal helix-hairpin-helix motif
MEIIMWRHGDTAGDKSNTLTKTSNQIRDYVNVLMVRKVTEESCILTVSIVNYIGKKLSARSSTASVSTIVYIEEHQARSKQVINHGVLTVVVVVAAKSTVSVLASSTGTSA